MPHNENDARYKPPISNEDLSERLLPIEAAAEKMDGRLKRIEANIDEMLGLFNASKWLIRFIAWAAPVAATIVGLFSYFRGPKG